MIGRLSSVIGSFRKRTSPSPLQRGDELNWGRGPRPSRSTVLASDGKVARKPLIDNPISFPRTRAGWLQGKDLNLRPLGYEFDLCFVCVHVVPCISMR